MTPIYIILLFGIGPGIAFGFFLGRAWQIHEDTKRILRSLRDSANE